MNSLRFTRREWLASSLAAWSLPALARAARDGARKEVSWLAEVQAVPKALPDDAPRLGPLLVDAKGRKIATLAGWQKRREQLRRWWLDFLGPLRVKRKGPPSLEILEEDRTDGVLRRRVRYEVEPGIAAEAYLLGPARRRGRAPGVVVLHSTVKHTIRQGAGVEGRPEKAFGLKLARRGCVTICPRCFLWPNDLEPAAEKTLSYAQRAARLRVRHPGSRGMAKMLHDATVALDILAGLPEVDPQRLGAVGHSLGAKEVLYLAALDERVKACVSSEGGIGTRFCNWDAPWYLDKDVRDESFGHEHHELLALVAPRAFLLLGGDAADGERSWPFIEAALPVYGLYGGAPRVGLFNHKKGHSVPPEAERRIAEWFEAYL